MQNVYVYPFRTSYDGDHARKKYSLNLLTSFFTFELKKEERKKRKEKFKMQNNVRPKDKT